MSQLGPGKLFEKIPTDLYRLWNNNSVAHRHKDTLLFKKSIREQRIRFYGNKELNEIIYGNSKKAREPPSIVSGDETITRLYTSKATDVRMRTSKKNESGILNQNICGSNQGYSTWKDGDPQGNGYTFANMAYPGAAYNVGSAFRERDIGNLFQMLFSTGNYLSFWDVELVADSHFGHITPIAFVRSYVTASFRASQRIGIKNITELSKEMLSKEDVHDLLTKEDEKGY